MEVDLKIKKRKRMKIKNVKAILAQSVERTALNRVVEGSIPSDRDLFFFFFFFKFNSIQFNLFPYVHISNSIP